MTPEGFTPTPSALAVRLRRVERIAGLMGVSVTVTLSLGLSAVFPAIGDPWIFRSLVAGVGFGCITAMLILTIKSLALIGATSSSGGSNASRTRAMQRAVLADDTSALNPEEIPLAPRWAAMMSLSLRQQLLSSVLLTVGLICTTVGSGTFAGPLAPLGWAFAGVLTLLLAMDAVLLSRQRRMHRFATREGAWAQ